MQPTDPLHVPEPEPVEPVNVATRGVAVWVYAVLAVAVALAAVLAVLVWRR
jgi:hypothetical protein